MPEFRGGANAHIRIVYSGGTADIAGQYRNSSLSVSNNIIDTTSGSTAWEEIISGISKWEVSYEGLHNGGDTPMGTVHLAALVPGLAGTVFWSPSGSAATNQRFTGAIVIESVEIGLPYDDVVTVSLKIRGNGALTINHW